MKRVVITGMGILSPIGLGKQAFWDNLLANKTGMDHISLFDASSVPSKVAAEVKGFEPKAFLKSRQIRKMSRTSMLAYSAYKMATEDASLDFSEIDLDNMDVIIGSAVTAYDILEAEVKKSFEFNGSYKKGLYNPLSVSKTFMSAPSCSIALDSKANGYVTTISTACTSGINAIGYAFERIQNGQANISITGSTDTPVNRTVYHAFCSANLLVTENDPKEALKPFDKRRTKHSLGEGAAIFILEELQHALDRKAFIYAEIHSFAQTSENMNEFYAIDKSGKRWANSIEKTLTKKTVGQIDYINAHGPSDQYIDEAENNAIKIVMGKRAKKVYISSIKGAVGQGFSSAGGFQVAASALTINHNVIPPTYNYKEPDPECDLNYSGEVQKPNNPIRKVLVNNHGFGGLNSTLVLGRY